MNNSVFKNAVWITTKEFSQLDPINIYHKEHIPLAIEILDEFKNYHTLFRKKFTFENNGERVILNISADDYYRLFINGSFVGQGPAQGYYFSYCYNQFDVTDFLKEGENQIEADVYYCGVINRAYNSGDRRMGLIAEMSAGNKSILCTDKDWEYCISKAYTISHTLGYDTMFAENFDSRFKATEYIPCFEKQTDHVFRPEPVKALQVYKKDAVTCERLEGGGYFYDFGTLLTGGLEIVAKGKSGNKVRILCGEETDDSEIKVRYNMRCTSLCEEFWILDEGENIYDQYEYRSFRYAAVIPEEDAEIVSVRATVRHYPFDDDYCNLQTDNQLLKDIWKMCKNTVKYGAQEVFVDCPTREKGQYAGDLTITSASHLVLTGDLSLFKKAIDNQMESSFICPGIMAVTPGALMQEIADYSLQFPILALRYYKHTGDKEYLAKCLKVCLDITAHFGKYAREDGLLDGVSDKWNLVDWPANLRDQYDFEIPKPIFKGCHNVINAFYIGCVKQTEEIQDILGIEHSAKSKALVEAFDKAFFNPETRLYTDSETSKHSSLHSNVLPAFYGFAKKDTTQSIGDFIMEKKFCCGVYMAYFTLKALCKMGRYEDAYSLIISEDESSWCNMLREGATTCFEAWGKDKKANTSLCHPWATAPISILAEDILPNMPQVGKLIYKA